MLRVRKYLLEYEYPSLAILEICLFSEAPASILKLFPIWLSLKYCPIVFPLKPFPIMDYSPSQPPSLPVLLWTQ
jgi:hypothetical protein